MVTVLKKTCGVCSQDGNCYGPKAPRIPYILLWSVMFTTFCYVYYSHTHTLDVLKKKHTHIEMSHFIHSFYSHLLLIAHNLTNYPIFTCHPLASNISNIKQQQTISTTIQENSTKISTFIKVNCDLGVIHGYKMD